MFQKIFSQMVVVQNGDEKIHGAIRKEITKRNLVGGTTCLKLIFYLNWKDLSKYQEDTNWLVVSIPLNNNI